MENTKYAELKERLKNALKTAKRLGLNVRPGGGYVDSSYSINNLPAYPVGLFGALSIVLGPEARCKLNLTFDETQSLEAGFNGSPLDGKSKKRKKRRSFKPNAELVKIGMELSFSLNGPRKYYGTSRLAGLHMGAGVAAAPIPAPVQWKAYNVYQPEVFTIEPGTFSYGGADDYKKALKQEYNKMLDGLNPKVAQPAPVPEFVDGDIQWKVLQQPEQAQEQAQIPNLWEQWHEIKKEAGIYDGAQQVPEDIVVGEQVELPNFQDEDEDDNEGISYDLS